MHLGDRLQQERKRLGYNQQDFASFFGLSTNAQLSYEKGRRYPDSNYLASFAVLGGDISYVLTGTNTPDARSCLNVNESEMIKVYRQLNTDDRTLIGRFAAGMLELNKKLT